MYYTHTHTRAHTHTHTHAHTLHVFLSQTTYAVVDMYGSAKSVMITSKASYVPAHPPPPRLTTSPVYSLVNPPEAPLPTYSPPLSLPIRLSQSCGSNVHLRTNLRSARRMKSSDHGIVLSEIVIPDFVIFEVSLHQHTLYCCSHTHACTHACTHTHTHTHTHTILCRLL